MRINVTIALLACVGLCVADERGRAVFEAEYAASHGYGDMVADIEMSLVSKTGRVSLRELRLRQMEAADSVKTLIVFDTPKAIRGTGLLTYSRSLADDDQWLYLPRLKRVKKISSRDRSGPFVGSEFAYEDLADYVVDEFTYEWMSEAPCEPFVCDVVRREPVDPFSGYSRQMVWVDQTHSRIRAVDYFDETGALLKKMKATEFRTYEVGERIFHQPHRLHMQNLQTGRSTTLVWQAYAFEQGLVESRDFTSNALKRVR